MAAANGVSEPAFPLATPNKEEGRSGLVTKTPDHLLPYGIIFEEYERRRASDLLRHTDEAFDLSAKSKSQDQPAPSPEEIRQVLSKALKTVANQYQALEEMKLSAKTTLGQIDRQEAACRDADKPLKRILHMMNGSALCLSGGGIRSASFGLGVLEGLARFSVGILDAKQTPKRSGTSSGLLHHLDYLSTVSGGGYIGSWLSAWIYRRVHAPIAERKKTLKDAREQLEKAQAEHDDTRLQNLQGNIRTLEEELQSLRDNEQWEAHYSEAVEGLAGRIPTTAGDPSPQPIRHLREYTSYLAPALGLSLDSWTLAAIVMRNIFINWLMLLPILFTLVALPQVSYYASKALAQWIDHCITVQIAGLLIVIMLFVIAAFFAAFNLPSHRSEPRGPSVTATVLGFALPVLLADWILAELGWSVSRGNKPGATLLVIVAAVAFGISVGGLACLCGKVFSVYTQELEATTHQYLVKGTSRFWRALYLAIAAVVSAALASGLAVLLTWKVLPFLTLTHNVPVGHKSGSPFCCQAAPPNVAWFTFPADDRIFMIFAVPLVIMIPLLTVSLLSGLLGLFEQEEDREWWSRVGAIQLAFIVTWIAAHAITLYSKSALSIIWLAVSGIGLGGVGSALGWSGKTSAGPQPVKQQQKGNLGEFLEKHDLLLPTVCGIALLLLFLGVSGGELKLAALLWSKPDLSNLSGNLTAHLVILFAAIVLAVLLNWAISINVFSLNGLYRMRLMRAFLGASNTQRQPNNFTGFDPTDTPKEIKLAHAPGAPLHVINTTLNLVGTKNTAWRQRKAEPFSFSPLHSGSWRLGYVPTQFYAGADGPSLATAMTISGAAFNPNMGYHSSPLVTLLMTFFNVRLGWWMPNPKRELPNKWLAKLAGGGKFMCGRDFLRRTGPSLALEPIIREALGLTNDNYRWIELTDGGHFENLGLYEMVMRRCKKIIVVDAGADPKCQFEDLGNALRKIEIDLGIPIRFESLRMQEGAKIENRYCAVATIDYGCVDSNMVDDWNAPEKQRQELADGMKGTLIYIKAALTGEEPPDIKQYSLTHDDFPHETTANQFFNESQFESYRHLGSVEVETIVKEGSKKSGLRDFLQGLFAAEGPLGDDFDSFADLARRYTA